MSVLGSALEIDLDPDGDLTCVPRHVGNTGTGCFRMHDHTMKDTKKQPIIPPDEKIEATYMYAPTPPEPTPEPSVHDEPDEQEDDAGHKDGHKKNGKGPGGDSPGDDAGGQHAGSPKESISPKESAKNNSSHNNGSNPPAPNNSHATPHLLDAPLQGATCQQVPDRTPALVILESKSQSPKTASIGEEYAPCDISDDRSPVRIFVREILDHNAPPAMDLETGQHLTRKDSNPITVNQGPAAGSTASTRKFVSRHSSDALDKASCVHEVGAGNPGCGIGPSVELIHIEAGRCAIPANMTAILRASSSVASDSDCTQQYKSLDRFGSIDSSDTFLSCATHPFPSQGSLAGLEELAAVGSMAANGSMPAVNIPSFNNGVYVNPFDPTRGGSSSGGAGQGGSAGPSSTTGGTTGGVCKRQRSSYGTTVRRGDSACTPIGTLTPSPQGSPHSRRVRIGGRSVSSDVELADFESDFSAANREAYHENVKSPKHRQRTRVSTILQGGTSSSNKPRPRFELDTKADASNAAVTALSNKDDKEEGASKRRPSYMPTRGLAAVLNQGLATLGEKLGKGNKGSNGSSTEALDMILVKGKPPVSGSTATVESGSGGGGAGGGNTVCGGGVGNNMASTATANGGASRKKSILKKSDSTMPKGSSLSGKMAVGASTADPELENLLVSDQESANNTPAVSRKDNTPAVSRKERKVNQLQSHKGIHGRDGFIAAATTATAGEISSNKGCLDPDGNNPIPILDHRGFPLPPTANNEQLKSLTGPKLRKAGAPMPPTGGNRNQKQSTGGILVQQKNGQNQNISNKNNGSVASKEIQTSTINLLALASAAASAAKAEAGNNNSDSNTAKKFEYSDPRESVGLSDTVNAAAGDNVFKCPNDMCRHNKISSAMTTNSSGKRKICLCGRTMLNQSLLLSQTPPPPVAAAAVVAGKAAESIKETSKQHTTTEKFIP